MITNCPCQLEWLIAKNKAVRELCKFCNNCGRGLDLRVCLYCHKCFCNICIYPDVHNCK